MPLRTSTLLLALPLCHLVAAAPNPAPKIVAADVNANFDDIPAPALVANPGLIPIGQYKSLEYDNFSNQQPTELAGKVVTGIQPHSNPNYATSGAGAGLGSGKLTSLYDGSRVLAYDLESFYFACFVGTANQAAVVPASCSVTASGYRAGVAKPSTFTFSFEAPPLPATTAAMVKVALPAGFKFIQTALFGMAAGVDVIPAYDNFVYRTYNVTG